ncbi:FAD-binding domain-domain-containing protein [Microdochium bolleyi]|uniref:FAD-binding domain-domain-containing protein n=1 Tax=Microdochium bolleyi TaxID=196109 RepID=A0A136JFX3_9PEZI|nr:FAD-binding domain-domain-containing protein [Microdochium bolleyi]
MAQVGDDTRPPVNSTPSSTSTQRQETQPTQTKPTEPQQKDSYQGETRAQGDDQKTGRKSSASSDKPPSCPEGEDGHGTKYLDDDEIEAFLDELDGNNNGFIEYEEVEHQLDRVHEEIAPKAAPHLRLHRDVAGKSGGDDGEADARHIFLSKLLSSGGSPGAGGTEEGQQEGGTGDGEQQHQQLHKKHRIPREEFKECVRRWKIPSMKQDKAAEKEEHDYVASMSVWRRVRAYWAVHGPEVMFLALVVAMHVGLGVWQCVKYATGPQYQGALGWGVVLAKTSAGALYASFFFLVISMSRYFSTFLRKFYYVSRFINWDLSQEFHIRMSIVALVLATLHAIGHLSGSFNWGSRPDRQDAVEALLGQRMRYTDFLGTRPGITGLIALSLFYVLAILSIPQVRKWNYQVFQLAHLLMFPILACLIAHGTSQLLQFTMFGYFLAFPTLLITAERLVRVATGFHRIKAKLRVLDAETVEISATIPSERLWRYEAGQYVFLQVPELSMWQWHPFTVSACLGKEMWLHIKTDGDWTGKLRGLAGEKVDEKDKKDATDDKKEKNKKDDAVSWDKVTEIEIGINGPFGAPAQRFYDFTHTIVVGGGIGVTPFSGILADLQAKDDAAHGGPSGQRKLPLGPGAVHSQKEGKDNKEQAAHSDNDGDNNNNTASSNDSSDEQTATQEVVRDPPHADGTGRLQPSSNSMPTAIYADDYRRVDFHWTVRERNALLWFSDLLNSVSASQLWHAKHDDHRNGGRGRDGTGKHLDINIHTHVTQTRKNISTHVYRWLLEMHRTEKHPESPLTGLINATRFGRPDFARILDEHYDEMRAFKAKKMKQRQEERRRRSTAVAAAAGDGASVSSVDSDDEDDKDVKVGVFYCGTPIVGEILADRCAALSARGRADGSKIEYHFMIEVFG